jgi:hypothetical protein
MRSAASKPSVAVRVLLVVILWTYKKSLCKRAKFLPNYCLLELVALVACLENDALHISISKLHNWLLVLSKIDSPLGL